MKYLFFIGLFFISCNDAKSVINESADCCKQLNVASINLCIPIFTGYTEVYSNLEVKKTINENQPKENNILAYFVLDSNELFTNFISVVIPNQWMDLNMDRHLLKELGNTFTKNLKDYIPNEFDSVSFDVPRLVDRYQLNNRIYSFIVLVKSKENGEAFLTHFSTILVNNRTFSIVTNKIYENRNTIAELKLRADNYNNKFMESNP